MHARAFVLSQVGRRGALLPDDYVLTVDDVELVSFLLAGQNFGSSSDAEGKVTWGAFGAAFVTLGELRAIARAHPAEEPPAPAG
ncbi:MAG: hypothetical protein ACLPYS_05430, partial [Vulcanimicrobiaceae bacterium]